MAAKRVQPYFICYCHLKVNFTALIVIEYVFDLWPKAEILIA